MTAAHAYQLISGFAFLLNNERARDLNGPVTITLGINNATQIEDALGYALEQWWPVRAEEPGDE